MEVVGFKEPPKPRRTCPLFVDTIVCVLSAVLVENENEKEAPQTEKGLNLTVCT
jgi:hypothetical protein